MPDLGVQAPRAMLFGDRGIPQQPESEPPSPSEIPRYNLIILHRVLRYNAWVNITRLQVDSLRYIGMLSQVTSTYHRDPPDQPHQGRHIDKGARRTNLGLQITGDMDRRSESLVSVRVDGLHFARSQSDTEAIDRRRSLASRSHT